MLRVVGNLLSHLQESLGPSGPPKPRENLQKGVSEKSRESGRGLELQSRPPSTGVPRALDFGALQRHSKSTLWVGILPGWYGMENGQKPEMKKKKNGSRNGKRPQAGQGQKWQKKKERPKNGFLREFSIILHFFAIFGPFCPCPAWGRFPFRFPFFFFSYFRLLAVFHAIPARQDPNLWALSGPGLWALL